LINKILNSIKQKQPHKKRQEKKRKELAPHFLLQLRGARRSSYNTYFPRRRCRSWFHSSNRSTESYLSSVVLYKKVVLLKFEVAECRWEFVVGCVWVSHLSRFGEVFYNTGIAIQFNLPSYGPLLLRFVCRCQNYVFKLVCIK
jgi:hypothetical protein